MERKEREGRIINSMETEVTILRMEYEYFDLIARRQQGGVLLTTYCKASTGTGDSNFFSLGRNSASKI